MKKCDILKKKNIIKSFSLIDTKSHNFKEQELQLNQ